MLLDVLFPNRCLHCSIIIDGKALVCECCRDQIHFTHQKFAEPNVLKERLATLFPVKGAFALMQFEQDSLSRKIVHQLKYRHRESIGKVLAEWTFERTDLGGLSPDLIATVPLHPKKMRQRGYNQLHVFADRLAELYKIPVDHKLLKRNVYKKAQALADRSHRAETENLFSLTRPQDGQHVLIVDDVITTGNTLSAVAWEILKQPQTSVSVIVMAID